MRERERERERDREREGERERQRNILSVYSSIFITHSIFCQLLIRWPPPLPP